MHNFGNHLPTAAGTEAMAVPQSRLEQEHAFLNYAKQGLWDAVYGILAQDVSFLSASPSGRWSALHQARF